MTPSGSRQVEASLEKIAQAGLRDPQAQIYATPRVAQLLPGANAEADRLKDEFIGTEHLFIAIAGEEKGEAASILQAVGH